MCLQYQMVDPQPHSYETTKSVLSGVLTVKLTVNGEQRSDAANPDTAHCRVM